MPKDPLNPRKSPRQARSRALVDALLTATSRVLERHGIDGATTTRIAETAGVSIGSLYQYFPNREALIGALIEAEAERLAASMEVLLAEMADAPPATTIEHLVALAFDSERLSPDLHALLNAEAGRLQRDVVTRGAVARITQAIEVWLAQHRVAIAPTDIASAAAVVEGVLEGLAHKVFLLATGERERLQRETVRLLSSYLLVDSGVEQGDTAGS